MSGLCSLFALHSCDGEGNCTVYYIRNLTLNDQDVSNGNIRVASAFFKHLNYVLKMEQLPYKYKGRTWDDK